MAISTAKVLESNLALSEFAGSPTTPVPAPTMRAAARVLPDLRIETGPAVTAKRRRVRVDWHLLGILLLILTSAAVCIYRLAWAMQP